MSSMHPSSARGFAFGELLVAIFLLGVATVAITGLSIVATRQSLNSERSTVASGIIKEHVEYIETIDYHEVGYTDASAVEPSGILERLQEVQRNQQEYLVSTTVSYADDPINGTVGALLNEDTADYKLVQVVVTWEAPGGSSQNVSSSTIITPGEGTTTLCTPGDPTGCRSSGTGQGEGACVGHIPCPDSGICPPVTTVLPSCPPGAQFCQECYSDFDCAAGQVCDTGDGTCVASTDACRVNADCAVGQACQDGFCRTACTADTDCNLNEVCNTATGVCSLPCGSGSACSCVEGYACNDTTGVCDPVPSPSPTPSPTPVPSPDPCTDDSECPIGEKCELTLGAPGTGVCGEPCDDDADCPGGEICLAGICAECIPGGDDSECGPGESCTSIGTCSDECELSEDCDGNFVCNPDTDTCEPCSDDSQCPSGEECNPSTGQCGPGCETNFDCPPPLVCSDSTCTTIWCDPDTDCITSSSCDYDDNLCRPTCNDDSDCPVGASCDATTGLCDDDDLFDMCEDNDDCDTPGLACIDNICQGEHCPPDVEPVCTDTITDIGCECNIFGGRWISGQTGEVGHQPIDDPLCAPGASLAYCEEVHYWEDCPDSSLDECYSPEPSETPVQCPVGDECGPCMVCRSGECNDLCDGLNEFCVNGDTCSECRDDNDCSEGMVCNLDGGVCDWPTCGNLLCDVGETSCTCPEDCGVDCGDGCCDFFSGEDELTCAVDCEAPTVCGDGICEADEDSTNCPEDCVVPVCGDEVCDFDHGEDEILCPEDCGAEV